jgi:hypothetical protein
MWFIDQFGSINTPKVIHYPAFLFAFGSLEIILHEVCRFAFKYDICKPFLSNYVFRKISFPKVGNYIGHELIKYTDTKAKCHLKK